MKNPESTPRPKAAPASKAALPPKEGPAPKDLETAQQIHTLANLIHGRLVALHPWLAPFPTPHAHAMPEMWPPTPPVGAGPLGWSGSTPWTG